MTTLLLATEAEEGAEAATTVLDATGVIDVAWLIPLLPLVGFVLVLALGRRLGERSGWLANAAAWASFVLSVAVFLQVLGESGAERRFLVDTADWITAGPLQVSYDMLVDPLTAIMLLVVTGVGSVIHLYSLGYMHGDERFSHFFAYLNLFLFSMLMLVLGGSLLTLFLGWELVGLSSYLLIGFWFENRSFASAAKKAFITNRVGDVSFVVAMLLTFATFGTLTFFGGDGGGLLQTAGGVLEQNSATALVIALLLLGGAVAKSAQIPLHVWLPDAMAGPTPVSALIHAATMVTAGVYLVARTSPLFVQSITAMTTVAWIGGATALLAALIAMRQDDIKRILAYSTVSQLGFMFIAVGVGAFPEGIFHLTTHAFFKGLLFLAAGSVMHALHDEGNVWRMGGLRRYLPWTFWTSAVAWLAISGVPPFAGFFSKDQILTTTYEHGYVGLWAVGVAAAVLTAFYMSRWFFLVFLGRERFSRAEVEPHESPRTMTVPLAVLAVLSALGGLVLNPTHHGAFFNWLEPYTAPAPLDQFTPATALSEGALIGISVVAALLGIALAYAAYLRREVTTPALSEPIRGVVGTLLERKFYVDELYEAVFVRAGGRLSEALAWFDRTIVDGVVNGSATVTSWSAGRLRRVQTGFARSYVAGVAVGAVALLAAFLSQVR